MTIDNEAASTQVGQQQYQFQEQQPQQQHHQQQYEQQQQVQQVQNVVSNFVFHNSSTLSLIETLGTGTFGTVASVLEARSGKKLAWKAIK
jgi:hypothetical protein